MFEKSLYDLIRGLRSHKGNEAEYIQGILKECRIEVRSQDMDVKATALLKLIYLEMFGHEMSWASFHVLEVMSSNKHLQKRVGYLGAAQTFRSDTEVLMLATNLLKKDLSSASIPTMSLALITLPHVITSSLALSLLTDILPRLSHSQPAVRKKTVVTLYRLALVYPETLRVAWPKIKERLMDTDEDSSVTAAVVNVVCELGWRRPQDFLPLAPRLFELLIEEGNNWMLIKIIKLFATLTPLEPRLVKKLVRPLTNLIQTTEAMSLLYECINGIVQGGIFSATENAGEGDELAGLCLGKLRGMIVVENDPNLKYVALLAFNKIVISYPNLVSAQQDVIMRCLDDPDISIRLQALELVSGMVSTDNIASIVNRLMKQLRNSPINAREQEDAGLDSTPIEPMADSDGEDPAEILIEDKRNSDMPPIPNDYRREVIARILEMCEQDTYSKIPDFEWYLDILVQIVRLLPPNISSDQNSANSAAATAVVPSLADRVGFQLRDIAVRVKALRLEACRAAESLLLVSNRSNLFPSVGSGADSVLEYVAWIVGEFSEYLVSPQETLNSLTHESCAELPPPILCAYLQAIPKVFLQIAGQVHDEWNLSEKTIISLVLARVVNFEEKLSFHPNLDVQERAVEYLELLRLLFEALASLRSEDGPPLLLTSAIPGLFTGVDLNPVAPGAQKKVSPPEDLDLTTSINPRLSSLLQLSLTEGDAEEDNEAFQDFYNEREVAPMTKGQNFKAYSPEVAEQLSYQAPDGPELIERRRAKQRERNHDDPFYIAQGKDNSGRSSPFDILRKSNGEELDLDTIPIVDLRLEGVSSQISAARAESSKDKRLKARRRVEIAADENFDTDIPLSGNNSAPQSLEVGNAFPSGKAPRPKKHLLQVDSSGLYQLSLIDESNADRFDLQRREAEEAEMAAALKEVERMRLEMQRAAERVETAEGVDIDGIVVKRKKKRNPRGQTGGQRGSDAEKSTVLPAEETAVVKKKKKKKRQAVDEAVVESNG
jgi:AP-3 complex subunit delta